MVPARDAPGHPVRMTLQLLQREERKPGIMPLAARKACEKGDSLQREADLPVNLPFAAKKRAPKRSLHFLAE